MQPFPTATGVQAWFIINKEKEGGPSGSFAFKCKSSELHGATLGSVIDTLIPTSFSFTSRELLKNFKDDMAVIYSNSPSEVKIMDATTNPEYRKLFGPGKLFTDVDKEWTIQSGTEESFIFIL